MTCAVCGAPAARPFRAPAPELAPDLDLRPGEPTRSTLSRWVACCRSCGACGPDLAALPAAAVEVVRGDAYRALRGPGRSFLRWAAICRAAGDSAGAAEATLQAAWALDDVGGDAAALRRQVAAAWEGDGRLEIGLRRVDVLRRAGAFAEAASWAAAMAAAADESTGRILQFQQERIAAADAGRHLMSSALRPPARTPHVQHGRQRPAAGGFWRRLFRS